MLYMPLRITTTGIMHGPDLAASMELLGKEKVLKRFLYQDIKRIVFSFTLIVSSA